MNTANLHELINRYEENFDMINNSEHYEIFKWKALNGFRKVWFSDEAKDMTFAQRFNAAMKDSSILINNSMISPTSGVVKLTEAYPERVEALFQETLFSGETDLVVVQDQMDRFLDEMEKCVWKNFRASIAISRKGTLHPAICSFSARKFTSFTDTLMRKHLQPILNLEKTSALVHHLVSATITSLQRLL